MMQPQTFSRRNKRFAAEPFSPNSAWFGPKLLERRSHDWVSRVVSVTLFRRSGARIVDAASSTHLAVSALAVSLAALFFSLLAAFPGLKVVVAAVRDGVLWFCLFLVLGGIACLAWQHFSGQQSSVPSTLVRPDAATLVSSDGSP
jgi:hypothetical protein